MNEWKYVIYRKTQTPLSGFSSRPNQNPSRVFSTNPPRSSHPSITIETQSGPSPKCSHRDLPNPSHGGGFPRISEHHRESVTNEPPSGDWLLYSGIWWRQAQASFYMPSNTRWHKGVKAPRAWDVILSLSRCHLGTNAWYRTDMMSRMTLYNTGIYVFCDAWHVSYKNETRRHHFVPCHDSAVDSPWHADEELNHTPPRGIICITIISYLHIHEIQIN